MSEREEDIKAELKAVMQSCPVQESFCNRIYVLGKHECQLSEGGENDLNNHYGKCKKQERHKDFIPVKDFRIEHLPEQLQDDADLLFQWIKAESDITVRVSVDFISPNRPEYYPGTNEPYPFGNMRGRYCLRTGTGDLNVLNYINGHGNNVKYDGRDKIGLDYKHRNETCQCQDCKDSKTPSNIWWEIIVTTATHVVFDEIEAKHTSVRLFFDEANCKKIIVTNFSVYQVDIENDWCKLKYVICNEEIGNAFFTLVQHEDTLQDEVRKKFESKPDVNFIFIVSHPHGCPKKISIGECKKFRFNRHDGKFNKDFKMVKLHYTNPTCAGSSGARVLYLSSNNSHVHGGTCELIDNYSSFGPYKYKI